MSEIREVSDLQNTKRIRDDRKEIVSGRKVDALLRDNGHLLLRHLRLACLYCGERQRLGHTCRERVAGVPRPRREDERCAQCAGCGHWLAPSAPRPDERCAACRQPLPATWRVMRCVDGAHRFECSAAVCLDCAPTGCRALTRAARRGGRDRSRSR